MLILGMWGFFNVRKSFKPMKILTSLIKFIIRYRLKY